MNGAFYSVGVKALIHYKPEVAGLRPDEVNEFFFFNFQPH
jgi:hypothetical protein